MVPRRERKDRAYDGQQGKDDMFGIPVTLISVQYPNTAENVMMWGFRRAGYGSWLSATGLMRSGNQAESIEHQNNKTREDPGSCDRR